MILGSAQDGGLPQFGSRSGLDVAARAGTIRRRFSSAVAIVGDDGRALLVDAGLDIRAHEEILLTHPAMQSRAAPAPVDGVVLTHAHVGHYAGLLHFGREVMAATAMPCWVTEKMAGFLSRNAPWSLAVAQGHLDLRPQSPPASFRPWPDLEVSLIPVPHRNEASDTVAVSVGGKALYLPDIDSWAEWPDAEAVIARHEVALLDATFWSAEELPNRDMSKIRHPLVPETLARFGALAAGRRLILTHLNHSNPVCDPRTGEHDQVLAAGFEVAEEGLIVGL